MIKALITDTVTLTVESGSIVNISEGQFEALGGIAVVVPDAAEVIQEKTEAPKPAKKSAKSKK